MSIEEAILLDTLRCRLDFLRTKNNLTTSEVAEQVAIPLEVYEQYEKGKTCPNVIELLFIADFYDVSIDYLIGRSENPERLF
ncbi:helix-turn-helix domain-containing protein [Enterococcus durans]|uniref:Toxin-antitoxin system, antitoxin component, Xre protein n=1 Tax=Enterococcus durans TaxID=53345 RepID=A0A367CDV6_9ENTE|nr:helix-turn-helix transcriptional regulator [Enterococcus durans]RCA10714.1 toxin-antitoxin system, antitoxin component, Xre protein [Enterococcus durans]